MGATRTQVFWATHSPLASITWFRNSQGGRDCFGHTFPGVAGTIGNTSIDVAAPCPRLIDTLANARTIANTGFLGGVESLPTGRPGTELLGRLVVGPQTNEEDPGRAGPGPPRRGLSTLGCC